MGSYAKSMAHSRKYLSTACAVMIPYLVPRVSRLVSLDGTSSRGEDKVGLGHSRDREAKKRLGVESV